MTLASNRPTTILVVEDNARHAGLMRDELEAEMPSAAVTLATTVAQAREVLAADRFDLCILDFQLPDGDGLELLRAIREEDRDEAVVLVTTSTSPEVAVEAMKNGAEDYIVKEEGYVSILPFVIREVLERVRMRTEHAALERRLARAEHLASLNTLMAGIAHNLNNPLTTVRTFLELLPERYENDAEFRTDYYALVLTELKRIRALIQSMMQAVAIPLAGGEESWPMPELLRELDLYVQGSTTEKKISYEMHVAEGLPLVHAGREAVKQALVILLDNAVAHSPEGGEVLVSVEATREPGGQGFVVVEVADQGPGVADDLKEKIFEPFFSTRSGGLGIGLFVAQCVARAHGGSLDVARREPSGASFALRLPAG